MAETTRIVDGRVYRVTVLPSVRPKRKLTMQPAKPQTRRGRGAGRIYRNPTRAKGYGAV